MLVCLYALRGFTRPSYISWGGVGGGGLHLSRPRATEGQRASTSDFARVSSDFERSRAISSEFEWIRVGSSTVESL